MKRLSVISLTLLSLLAALLVGCGGSHDARVTAELDCADSLLLTSDTAAHSAALRQMLALDTARTLQADEALRARHALLLVQARYKCYVTEPADSALIGSALSYYTDHHGSSADHERYTRALIFSGAVAEELGHPQQAMQHYLEAESTADPNDHFNLGYTNLRMAVLLSSYYVSDGSDIEHYMKAYRQFVLSGERRYQGICLGNTGGILRITDNNVAKPFLKKGIAIMKEVGDSTYYYDFTEMLAKSYLLDSCYDEAGQLIHNCLISNQEFHKVDFYFTAAELYANLNKNDSAHYYLRLSKRFPYNARDSLFEHMIQSSILGNEHSYQKLSVNLLQSDSILSHINSNTNTQHITSAEKNHAKFNLSTKKYAKYLSSKYIIIIFVLFFLLLFSLFLFLWKRDKKKWQSLVTELYENRNELEDNHTDLLAATKKHEALRALLMQHFKLMDELIKLGDSNPNNKLSQQLKDQIRATYSDKNFVTEMRNFVSMHADETLTDFLDSCDKNLNETENNIVTLTACGFSSPEIALLTNQKDASYIRVVRHRISKKLNLDTPLEQYLSAHFKL